MGFKGLPVISNPSIDQDNTQNQDRSVGHCDFNFTNVCPGPSVIKID